MIKIVATLKRKKGMSKEEFRKYYEEKHLLLCYEQVRGIALDYRRNYIEQSFGAGKDGQEFSDPLQEEYDVVTEVWFKSREDLDKLYKKLQEQPSLSEAMIKDESNLFDRDAHKFMICEEVITDPAMLR